MVQKTLTIVVGLRAEDEQSAVSLLVALTGEVVGTVELFVETAHDRDDGPSLVDQHGDFSVATVSIKTGG